MLLKYQIKRLLKSWRFSIALLIEFIIVICQALTINHINADHWIKNAFLHLTGFDNTGIGSPIYFLVLPLLVSFVAGSTYQQDKTSKFLTLNLVRINERRYLRTTLLSSFIVGGLVGTIPLILEGIYFFTKYPINPLPYTKNTQLIDKVGWSFNLFMSHPLEFWLMFILIIFIFSGIFSQISIVSSYFDIHSGLETIIPFVVVIASVFIGGFTHLNLELNALIAPNYSNESSTSIYYLIGYVIVFETIIWYLTWRKCHEDNFS